MKDEGCDWGEGTGGEEGAGARADWLSVAVEDDKVGRGGGGRKEGVEGRGGEKEGVGKKGEGDELQYDFMPWISQLFINIFICSLYI